MKKLLLIGCLLSLMSLPQWLYAQDDKEIAPVTRSFVLKNANIVVQPGQMIERGQILVRNGLIEAVGKTVTVPVNAKVIDADSMYVYAGFIEGLSHTGIPSKQAEQGRQGRQQRPEVENPGDPPRDIAGIQPERSAVELIKEDEKSIADMRQLGFTIAHVVPDGKMLPGQGAIVLLGGDDPARMVLADKSSMFAQLQGAGGVYPATVIAVMAKWRELYRQAQQAKMHAKNYRSNPRGMARPGYDAALQAFYPVIDGGLPVFFAAEGVKDAYRVLQLQEELQFPLVLAEVKQGYHMVDDLKAKGFPLLLSLDLPENKDKDKKKADKEEKEAEPGDDTTADASGKVVAPEKSQTKTDPEQEALNERRQASLKQYYSQAAMMADAGIDFGFSTLQVKSKDLRANLRTMIENGLSEDKALAALTTTPARMLGISEMAGTVEQGKIANLVITDKPYFAEESNVRYVFVDGKPYEYEGKKKKKAGDPTATVAVAGEWAYAIVIPNQVLEGKFTLNGAGDDLSGTITNPNTGEEGTMENITLDGNNLTFTVSFEADGQTIVVEYDVVIDGDNFEGTVTAGSLGVFDVEGERLSVPD